MFCPECKAEYLPPAFRCPDCGVPLVEHLAVTKSDSERKKLSGFIMLKELGIFIVIPILVLSVVLVSVGLRESPFAIPAPVAVAPRMAALRSPTAPFEPPFATPFQTEVVL
jgi:hypothetical protein